MARLVAKPGLWSGHKASGGEGDRTPDLLNAIQALSQLSYTPDHPSRDAVIIAGAPPLSTSFAAPPPPRSLRLDRTRPDPDNSLLFAGLSVGSVARAARRRTAWPCQGPRVNATFWKNLAKYGLGIALLAFVIWSNWEPASNPDAGLKAVLQKPVRWLPLALASLLWTAGLFITFVRWYVLVRALNLPFSFRSALRLGLIGCYFNTFLPGAVGGDILKAAFIAREQNRRTAAVATVLMDRAVGLWGLFWVVAALGAFFWLTGAPEVVGNDRLRALITFCITVVIASLAGWLLLGLLPQRRADRFAGRLAWLPKVGKTLAELWRTVWLYRKQNRAVFEALGLSLVAHSGFVLTFHFAVQTFNSAAEVASLTQHILIVPVGLTVQALVFTPGGLGFGELGFGELYKLLGRPAAVGVQGSLVQRMIACGVGLLGLLVYRRLQAEHPPELAELEATRTASVSAPAVTAPAPAASQ
jgi:uncharacterized protein (TIRG00374 family)